MGRSKICILGGVVSEDKNLAMNYLILTENDESAWDDNTGISYHFPYKYRSVIIEGSEIIYYKSKIKKSD